MKKTVTILLAAAAVCTAAVADPKATPQPSRKAAHNRNSLGTEMKVTANTQEEIRNKSSQPQDKHRRYTPNNLLMKSVDPANPMPPGHNVSSKKSQPKVSKLAVKEKESDDSTTEKNLTTVNAAA